MHKTLFLLSLWTLTQCSLLPMEKNFLTDITGNYKGAKLIDDSRLTYDTEFTIPASGDFTALNQHFQLEQVLSETNAIYLVDDTVYIGLYIIKTHLQLKFIRSKNNTQNGVNLNPKPNELITLSSKQLF